MEIPSKYSEEKSFQLISQEQEQVVGDEYENNSPSKYNNEIEQNFDLASVKCDYEHQTIKGQVVILQYAANYKFSTRKDEYRVQQGHKNGGSLCMDKKIVEMSRGVGKYMLKQIGRKFLSGDLNLTTVSFPIKAMIPKSALELMLYQTILFPLYINRASLCNNAVERLKLLMVATISNFIQANGFLKPLNPVLGETFEGSYDDGTKLFAEQISHHPPISYFFVQGPKDLYKFWGYYLYEASAGLNSMQLINKGKRYIRFPDGQQIAFDYNQELFSDTFIGTLKHESKGIISFKDEKNGLLGTITIGKVKKKPTDYVDGDIKHNGKQINRLFGSYNGFLEWDGIRYWDCRDVLPFKSRVDQSLLLSDHTLRQDRLQMLQSNMVQAQMQKEQIEQIQRQDAKLRKEYKKIINDKIDKKKPKPK